MLDTWSPHPIVYYIAYVDFIKHYIAYFEFEYERKLGEKKVAIKFNTL